MRSKLKHCLMLLAVIALPVSGIAITWNPNYTLEFKFYDYKLVRLDNPDMFIVLESDGLQPFQVPGAIPNYNNAPTIRSFNLDKSIPDKAKVVIHFLEDKDKTLTGFVNFGAVIKALGLEKLLQKIGANPSGEGEVKLSAGIKLSAKRLGHAEFEFMGTGIRHKGKIKGGIL